MHEGWFTEEIGQLTKEIDKLYTKNANIQTMHTLPIYTIRKSVQ